MGPDFDRRIRGGQAWQAPSCIRCMIVLAGKLPSKGSTCLMLVSDPREQGALAHCQSNGKWLYTPEELKRYLETNGWKHLGSMHRLISTSHETPAGPERGTQMIDDARLYGVVTQTLADKREQRRQIVKAFSAKDAYFQVGLQLPTRPEPERIVSVKPASPADLGFHAGTTPVPQDDVSKVTVAEFTPPKDDISVAKVGSPWAPLQLDQGPLRCRHCGEPLKRERHLSLRPFPGDAWSCACGKINLRHGATETTAAETPKAKPAISPADFEKDYCEGSNMPQRLYTNTFVTLPCDCDSPTCRGWVAVSRGHGAIAQHLELYWPYRQDKDRPCRPKKQSGDLL